MLSIISAISLIIIVVLCAMALLGKVFDDSWPQHIGIVLVAAWASFRLVVLFEGWEPEPLTTVGHLGLCVYALGTARKAWIHRHETSSNKFLRNHW